MVEGDPFQEGRERMVELDTMIDTYASAQTAKVEIGQLNGGLIEVERAKIAEAEAQISALQKPISEAINNTGNVMSQARELAGEAIDNNFPYLDRPHRILAGFMAQSSSPEAALNGVKNIALIESMLMTGEKIPVLYESGHGNRKSTMIGLLSDVETAFIGGGMTVIVRMKDYAIISDAYERGNISFATKRMPEDQETAVTLAPHKLTEDIFSGVNLNLSPPREPLVRDQRPIYSAGLLVGSEAIAEFFHAYVDMHRPYAFATNPSISQVYHLWQAIAHAGVEVS